MGTLSTLERGWVLGVVLTICLMVSVVASIMGVRWMNVYLDTVTEHSHPAHKHPHEHPHEHPPHVHPHEHPHPIPEHRHPIGVHHHPHEHVTTLQVEE